MVVDHLWREWDIPGLLPQARAAREAQQRLLQWHAKLGRIAARYAVRLDRGAPRRRVGGAEPMLVAAGG
jgi:hypothetical protein